MVTIPPAITKELKTLDRKDVANWLRRGQLLCEVRELLGADASFGSYVRRELSIAVRTAQKAMLAWRHFGDAPHGARVSIGAMTILAPYPDARAEALELAAKQRITQAAARRLVAKYQPTKPTKTKLPPGFQQVIPVGDLVIVVKGKTQPTREEIVAALLGAARALPAMPAPPVEEPTSGSWLRSRKAG